MLLEAKKISKKFPGVQALKDVDFNLKAGEVHAIIGENGAGKSTLMHILSGIYEHDSGEFYINNKLTKLNSFQKAKKNGISIVFQERSLFPNLSIEEFQTLYLNGEAWSLRNMALYFFRMIF